MRVTLVSDAFSSEAWLFEVKWDGYRVEAVVGDGTVALFTRNGNDAGAYFPGLLDPPTWILASEAIVDGEVVALDAWRRPDFALLQERISAARAGRAAPAWSTRCSICCTWTDARCSGSPSRSARSCCAWSCAEGPVVRYAGHVEAEGVTFFAAAPQQGLEGIVAKQRTSPYLPGERAPTWLKVKIRPEQELVVGGWTPREGPPGPRRAGRGRVPGRCPPVRRARWGPGSALEPGDLVSRLDPLRVDAPPFDPAPDPATGVAGAGTSPASSGSALSS